MWMRGWRLAIIIAIAIPVLIVAYVIAELTGWGSQEGWIQYELARLSRPGDRKSSFERYEFICFNYSDLDPYSEFVTEARQVGAVFSFSKNCRNFRSDIAGVIGLVREGTISCIPVDIPFVLTEKRAMCIKPGSLRVERKIFTKPEPQPTRPWSGKPGNSYYEIGERKP